MVATVVLLPTMLTLFLLVVQAGLYWHTRAAASSAAHRGLDAARVEEGTVGDAVAVTGAFLDRHALGLRGHTVDATRDAGQAEVTVSGHVTSVLFGIDLPAITVTARAPVEEVTP